MQSEKRILWIDVARGIAILLVVMGHCIGDLNNPGNRFILAFHMPLFFFLSGLCISEKIIPMKDFVLKKMRTLMLPQIVLGSINFILNRGGVNDFLVWFLLVLFYVSIIFNVLQRMGLFEQKIGQSGVLIANIFLVILVDVLHIETLVHIEIIPMAFLFYSFGYYVKRKKVMTVSNDSAVIQHIWILLGPATVIISAFNTPVAMYENTYGNLFLFMLGAIFGIAFVCELAKELESNTLLGWYGRNSIIIYVLHFGMIKVLHLLGKIVFPGIAQSNYSYPYNWIYFIAIAILIIPIGCLCNRYVPFLFGKATRK